MIIEKDFHSLEDLNIFLGNNPKKGDRVIGIQYIEKHQIYKLFYWN